VSQDQIVLLPHGHVLAAHHVEDRLPYERVVASPNGEGTIVLPRVRDNFHMRRWCATCREGQELQGDLDLTAPGCLRCRTEWPPLLPRRSS
jgi:hypothetical protein